MKRVGNTMLRAIEFIKLNPGCSKYACARHLSPSVIQMGYAVISRCIKAGVVTSIRDDERDKGGFKLFVMED